MTIDKKDSKPVSPAKPSVAKRPVGLDYWTRVVDGKQRMTEEQKVLFAKAIEKGFAVGARLQYMFSLRDAVAALLAAGKPDETYAIELDQDDAVLQLLDEGNNAAKEFIDACGPLVALLPALTAAHKKLNTFLKENRVFEANRRSFTERQVAAIAVARAEKQLGNKVRLEPKELVEFFSHLDFFAGKAPDADAWKDKLWTARGRADENGKTKPEKGRGIFLSKLEAAAEKNQAKKKPGR